jgi:hypothetical protein
MDQERLAEEVGETTGFADAEEESNYKKRKARK